MLATDTAKLQLLPDPAQLQAAGASWTAREISQQPRLWQQLAEQHQTCFYQLSSDVAQAQSINPRIAVSH